MSKHLGLFNTQDDFSFGSENLEKPWVSYIVETNEVVYKDIEVSDSPGTIVLGNSEGKRKYVTVDNYNAEQETLNGYSAIGIIVIPKSHTDDGKGRMMSLDIMSVSTPDTGAKAWNVTGDTVDNTLIYYGGYGTDVETLNNYTQVAAIGTSDKINELGDVQTLVSGNSYGMVPSNICETADGSETGITTDGMRCIFGTNPYDPETKWFYFTQGTTENPQLPLLPSPYLADGSINSIYRATETATSDMDGMGNTKKLLDLSTGQMDWRTASTIINNSGATYYPAACCCWRYSTVGTVQGDWYLPSCGELGYLAARARQIQDALNAVNGFTIEGEESAGMPNNSDVLSLLSCWSSSEFSSYTSYLLSMILGDMYFDSKGLFNPVVAFSPAF